MNSPDGHLLAVLMVGGAVGLAVMGVTFILAPKADFRFRPVRVLGWMLTRCGALALLAGATAGIAVLPRLPLPCGVSGAPPWCMVGSFVFIGVAGFAFVALVAEMLKGDEPEVMDYDLIRERPARLPAATEEQRAVFVIVGMTRERLMGATSVEWARRPGTRATSWNPVVGCTRVSEGCAHCYARRMHGRFAALWGVPPFDQLVTHPERLEEPLRWRQPRTVFVCSMSDLFHEDVPFEFVDDVMGTASRCMAHTFIVLTKRPERMVEWWRSSPWMGGRDRKPEWPPCRDWAPNIWAGITIETQARAEERVPLLLEVPAPVRFVSAEPLLGRLDLRRWLPCEACGAAGRPELPDPPESFDPDGWFPEGSECGACGGGPEGRLAWVIAGAETGPGARPMELEWVRILRDQCAEAGAAFFFKQAAVKGRKRPLPYLDRRQHIAWPGEGT